MQNGHCIDVNSELEKLLSIEDKTQLRTELLKILEENQNLREKIAELEENSKNDFMIDTIPIQEEDEQHETQIRYNSSLEVLTIPTPNEEKNDSKRRVKGNSCWNCDKDDHSIKDCKEPRNPSKISKNRREFLKNQPASNVRYHIEEAQKFSHLTPGLPSKKLRSALGLKDDQIPSYIYRMRELGYPPGWLKQAEISHSNVALFVEKDSILPDYGDEDGEIADSEDKKQYDVSKLQTWPGFNVEMSSEFKDETSLYRVSAMKSEHSKEVMAGKMSKKEQKGYVRGEMQDTSTKKQEIVVKQVTKQSTDIKSIDQGTPIVQLYSPFENLPAQDAWKTNTTDHILFENLPDATGKWEEMRGLVSKIRQMKKK